MKKKFRKYIRLVEKGEVLMITREGNSIARIVPAKDEIDESGITRGSKLLTSRKPVGEVSNGVEI